MIKLNKANQIFKTGKHEASLYSRPTRSMVKPIYPCRGCLPRTTSGQDRLETLIHEPKRNASRKGGRVRLVFLKQEPKHRISLEKARMVSQVRKTPQLARTMP